MTVLVEQGEIVKVERIKSPVLVVSKGFFNQSGEIIGCPIIDNSPEGPLHIPVKTDDVEGCVHCEKMTLLDLNVRRFSKLGRIPISDVINISDAIQGIFDYM